MASVDNRVVQMTFDNASFERNISTTLSSLGQLDKAISGTGAKSGLADLGKEVGRFNLGGMASAIEGVSGKFLAMSAVGITAIANITNRAIDAGIQLGKSLTLDPILDGFAEYELNMKSIQTILANTRNQGTNLTDVNNALDELNEYSDLTIYNFAQMTKNIGAATAAGIDLDTAVTYVKGFANSAAVAGADASAMAGGLEQMSQALGAGVIKAQDWISLEKRGLAGQVQQEAFFNMAKAMGTLADVPLDKSFKDWTAEGNTLKGSLQDGWLTAEVFTNTMGVFAGEMDKATLAGLGFTEEMAAEAIELGQVAVDSATKVRTLSQLMDTTKEAVASGWSETFRIVFGDFEQASKLFTNLSNAIGDIVGRSATRRNAVLGEWADPKGINGRTRLIEALGLAVQNLGKIFKPIRNAFRDIFPRTTADDLDRYTTAFEKFAAALEPTKPTMLALRGIFTGFFAALKGVGEIIGAVARGFALFVEELLPLGDGDILGKTGKSIKQIGLAIRDFDEEKIVEFFGNMAEKAKDIVPIFGEIRTAIADFFKGLDFSGVGNFFSSIGGAFGGISFDTGVFDAITGRFDAIKSFVDKVGDVFGKIGDILSDVWEEITGFFDGVGTEAAKAAENTDWDGVTDALSVGLIGAIALMIKKFLSGGIDIDFGGGVLKALTGTFEQLTGVLKAMQADIKADALLKIAAAIAVLTASVLVLSLIDSAALAKALTAMAVGFGQLLGAFALINKLSFGPRDTAKMAALAVGLGLLAGAILILSFAAKNLGSLDWGELARGLIGTTVLLGVLVATSIALDRYSGTMIRAGTSLMAIALALGILAVAMKIFATMSWTEIGKGLTGVVIGLSGIALAMKLMPNDLAMRSAGIVAISFSLILLGAAMKIFASLSWTEMLKGMVGIAGGLTAIVLAMRLMPTGQMAASAGVILALSIAMLGMASALKKLAALSLGEIIKGVVAIIGIMIALSIALRALEGTEKSSLGLLLMVFSLGKLADVIQVFSGIPILDIVKGVLAMVGALVAIGLTAVLLTPATSAMLLLGVALLAIGAGFALFGVGAQAVAKAFQILAVAGEAGAKGLINSLTAIGKALPALMVGFGKGLIELVGVLAEGIPEFVELGIELLLALLEGLTEVLPQLFEFVGTLLTNLLALIREAVPEIIETGVAILMAFLEGIRDAVPGVVTVVADIIINFLDAMAAKVPEVISSLVTLFTNIFLGVAEGLGRVAGTLLLGTGVAFIGGFMQGLKDTVDRIKIFWNGIPGKIIRWVGNVLRTLFDKGVDLITGLIDGIDSIIGQVESFFAALPGNIFRWIGNVVGTLFDKGWDLITGLLQGIEDFTTGTLIPWLAALPGKVPGWIGSVASTLLHVGNNFFVGLYNGIIGFVNETLIPWLGSLPGKIVSWIGDVVGSLLQVGRDVVEGIKQGILNSWDSFVGWVKDKIGGLVGDVLGFFGIGGPSKYTVYAGEMLMLGLKKGIQEFAYVPLNAAETMADDFGTTLEDGMKSGVQRAIEITNSEMSKLGALTPTIQPVVDLTNVQASSRKIQGILGQDALSGSLTAAGSISRGLRNKASLITEGASGEGVVFQQVINSPTQLSTGDIYRQTRNQITMAKEELAIR